MYTLDNTVRSCWTAFLGVNISFLCPPFCLSRKTKALFQSTQQIGLPSLENQPLVKTVCTVFNVINIEHAPKSIKELIINTIWEEVRLKAAKGQHCNLQPKIVEVHVAHLPSRVQQTLGFITWLKQNSLNFSDFKNCINTRSVRSTMIITAYLFITYYCNSCVLRVMVNLYQELLSTPLMFNLY